MAGAWSPSPSPASSTAPSTLSGESTSNSPAMQPNVQIPDESSKLRTFLGILRKFIGVADIASVRFSLPAQLLEPTPNLEYWNYLDRPETFVSIGDSDDPLERMLAVLRFWFTKDLKYVKGKPCKPYNSTLGEFFRCTWDVEDQPAPILSSSPQRPNEDPSTEDHRTVRVSYLTEQTSHHPPVSAFVVTCPDKGITARGFDQISAKFTGTSVRVTPGAHNLGIFVTLHRRNNEEYQLTHPTAHLGGLLRGSLSVTVSDLCYITCPTTKIKVILRYVEEGWLGRTQNKVEGVVFRYDPEHDVKIRIKDVPEKDILAKIEGNWQDKLYFSLPQSSDKQLLIDLNPLFPVPKTVPPEDQQLPNESRRFWQDVTRAILAREYGSATTLKQQIEERQREKAAQRQARQEEWRPRFFTGATTPVGRPEMTAEGEDALRRLGMGDYVLTPATVTGA